MDKISIAICDDDEYSLKQINEMMEKWCPFQEDTIQTACFISGEELLDSVSSGHDYDLYILDVIMPGLDGIKLGKELRTLNPENSGVPVIYLSSSREFAVDSYEVRAFYYLLKPVSYEQFDKVLSEAVQYRKSSKSRIIPVRTRTGTFPVSYDEICYVILENRTLKFLCLDRTITSVTIPGSFRSATEQLSGEQQFVLCGASMLVSLLQIKSIDKDKVTFSNDVCLSVPRNAAKPLYKAWLDFWLE